MDSERRPWEGRTVPTDLIIEILVRLPRNDIGKCMLTCKKLYSTIRSVQFINSHLNHSKIKDCRVLIVKKTSFITFCESDMTLVKQESGRVPFPVIERDLYILGSCKGLVLVRLRVKRGWLVLLWNPSLEKFKRIDNVCFRSPWLYVFALGFHEASDDYRVVRIGTISGKYPKEAVDVYSLTRDSWHEVNNVCILPAITFPEEMPTYLNGAVHWIAKELNCYKILSFDFKSEVFKVIELPGRYSNDDEAFKSLDLKEFDGKLALHGVYYHSLEYPPFTCVMMNYPFVETWTDINLHFENGKKKEQWPIACTKKGNFVFGLIRSSQRKKLVYYNAKEDKFYDLGVVTPYKCPVIVDFVECLVLLDVKNESMDDHMLMSCVPPKQ